MSRTIPATIALVTLLVPAAWAGSSSAQMGVSVQVLARAIVTVASQPEQVTVTAADVARGFVDVASPIVIHGRTNSRAGYMLHVANVDATFASIQLAFGDASMNVAGEGWIHRPYVPGGETFTVNARLRLSPGAVPGQYSLPLAVSANPL